MHMSGARPRVLIVGTGLTGSLTCFHLRQRCGGSVRIEVADMARGAGGRMSTTRWGPGAARANTGAQCISCFSPEAAALLETVCQKCPVDRVDPPVRRSTHFVLEPESAYSHWVPPAGTNSVVKQFLHAGQPDQLLFESRLERLTRPANKPHLYPQFDRGGGLASCYDVIVLAMPPKDILRFFSHSGSAPDAQSQADLHRQTNRGRGKQLPQGHQQLSLPPDAIRRLRTPTFVGRYSLALWLDDDEFIDAVQAGWDSVQGPHPVIDMLAPQQPGVLVVQSSVELWKRVEGGGRATKGAKGKGARGGGREAARVHILTALEQLAGRPVPRAQHTKLLNWRTSQAAPPLPVEPGRPVVTAEQGQLVFTGDWCVESSFEGCNIAAQAAVDAVVEAVSGLASHAELGSASSADNRRGPEREGGPPKSERSRNKRNRTSKVNRVQR